MAVLERAVFVICALLLLSALSLVVYAFFSYWQASGTDCLANNFCRQFPVLIFCGQFSETSNSIVPVDPLLAPLEQKVEETAGLKGLVVVCVNRINMTLEVTRGSPNNTGQTYLKDEAFSTEADKLNTSSLPSLNHTSVYASPLGVSDSTFRYRAVYKNKDLVRKLEPSAEATFLQSDAGFENPDSDEWAQVANELTFERDIQSPLYATLSMNQKVVFTGRTIENKKAVLKMADMNFLLRWVGTTMYKTRKKN